MCAGPFALVFGQAWSKRRELGRIILPQWLLLAAPFALVLISPPLAVLAAGLVLGIDAPKMADELAGLRLMWPLFFMVLWSPAVLFSILLGKVAARDRHSGAALLGGAAGATAPVLAISFAVWFEWLGSGHAGSTSPIALFFAVILSMPLMLAGAGLGWLIAHRRSLPPPPPRYTGNAAS